MAPWNPREPRRSLTCASSWAIRSINSVACGWPRTHKSREYGICSMAISETHRNPKQKVPTPYDVFFVRAILGSWNSHWSVKIWFLTDKSRGLHTHIIKYRLMYDHQGDVQIFVNVSCKYSLFKIQYGLYMSSVYIYTYADRIKHRSVTLMWVKQQ